MSRMFGALRGGRFLLRIRPSPRPVRRPLFLAAVRCRHSAAKKHEKPDEIEENANSSGKLKGTDGRNLEEQMEMMFRKAHQKAERPLTEEEINDPDAIPISIYEEDPTSPTGERLVKHLRTPEERREHNRIYKLMLKADKDPNYQDDNPEINRYLIDELIQDPYFADLTEELQDIKKNQILTKRQQEQALKKAQAAHQAEVNHANESVRSMMQLANFDMVEEMINDPEYAPIKDELSELQDALPELGGDEAEYNAALERVLEKMGEDPEFEKKMMAQAEKEDLSEEGVMAAFEKEWENSEPAAIERDMTKLLGMMKDLMGSMGHDEGLDKLESEIEDAWNGKVDDEAMAEEEARAQEMSFAELGRELLKFGTSNPEGGTKDFGTKDFGAKEDAEDSEPVDPALEAKVDEIMKDPRLMEKLMYIQKIIDEEKQKQAQMNIPVELAPDPTRLQSDRTTSLKERMQVAQNDPEHSAALQALCVQLPRPFNISPALRLFNDAIQFAYVGANDEVRRILWRAYSKARTLPNFLQTLSDDAWDLLYYSQAVTWRGNMNREAHLRMLLQDLESVGKDGPPTHPDTIAAMQQQE